METYHNAVDKLNSMDAQFQKDLASQTKKVDEEVNPIVAPLDKGVSESSVAVSRRWHLSTNRHTFIS